MAKYFLKIYLITLVISSLIIGLTVYIVDPLQFFRQSSWYFPRYGWYAQKQMYLNPALARTYEYDTILIGNSLMGCFVPSYIDKLLKTKTLKLSIPGSSHYDQSIMLKAALRNGKTKNVIWGIEPFWYKPDFSQIPNYPNYLFDKYLHTKLLYLYNIDFIKDSIIILSEIILYGKNYINCPNFSLDKIGNYYSPELFCAKNALKNYPRAIINTRTQTVYAEAHKHVLNIIIKNPQIKFTIFFPPISILMHVHLTEESMISYLNLKKEIIEHLLAQENVSLYDFEIKEINHNLDNYWDPMHYSEPVANYMSDCFKTGKHKILKSSPYIIHLLRHFKLNIKNINYPELNRSNLLTFTLWTKFP